MTPIRALIVTGKLDWIGLARMPRAMADHGFQTSVICPANSLVAHARSIHRLVTFATKIPQQEFWKRVMQEISQFQPDILIPGDDLVVRLLHALHQMIAGDARHAFAKELLERSLGDPSTFVSIERKSGLIEMARQADVPIPESRLLTSEQEALSFATEIGYPIILKPDFGSGGIGVVKCADDNQLKQEYAKILKLQQPVLGQRFVNGQTVTVNVVVEKGRVAESFSLLRERTHPGPFGISALVRLIDHVKLQELTARVFSHFGFSGLGAAQFLIDERKEPLLMELIVRPSPLTYAGELFGADLIAGLRSILLKEPPPPKSPPVHQRVAIFPTEWLRDPNSSELRDPSVYHDVPWDEPQLLAAIVRQHINA
jgi:Carbamoyl-phosphate synthase L chain, ATP binding domain